MRGETDGPRAESSTGNSAGAMRTPRGATHDPADPIGAPASVTDGPAKRTGPTGMLARAAGWLLLAVPFIPLARIFDEPRGTDWLIPPGEWLLGLAVFGGGAWVAARLFPDLVERGAGAFGRFLRLPGDRAYRVGALATLAAILLVASTFAFSHSPLLIDTIIQLFQAKILASGSASAPAPIDEAFFATQHMIVDGARWYSQYPPGHAAALAVGVWLGAPWIIPILLTLGTAWLIGDTTKRILGEDLARLTLVLLILSPFFWLMGASHMNHVSALFFVALFLWCLVRWEASGARWPWILAAGLALGAAFLSRPLTAVAVGAAFIPSAIRIAGRRWAVQGLVAAAGFAGTAIYYFLFNAATTGDPLTPGYMKIWGASHGLGFHMSPWGDVHTPLAGLRNELIDLGLLHGFLFEWAIPALLPLGAVLALGWMAGRWQRRLLAGFFAIPIAYFFYWHRDDFLGPRYLYEGLPFLIPLLAASYVELRRRLAGREIRWLAGVDAGTLIVAVIGLSFLYTTAYGAPQRFRVYATSLASVKRDLVRDAEAAGIDEGVVFVAVSWGNRLLARARGMGASASVTERVYQASDHCELDLVVRNAEAGGWDGETLDREMLGILRPEEEVDWVPISVDPTLRLVPGRPLPERCAEEIRYDSQGFTSFSPHLDANEPDLRGRFVFARDLRARNALLLAEYPGVPAYLYREGAFIPLGDE